MRQKSGKRSAADLDITTTEPPDLRLEPPAFLSATEAALFREVLLNVPAGHFARADQYLLATFCQVTMLCRQTAKAATKANAKDAPTRFKMLFEAVKTQALIATKLRLTVQSRITPRTAGRAHDTHRPSVYDLMSEKGFDVQ